MNYLDLGYLRTAAVSPVLSLGDPLTNAHTIIGHLQRLEDKGVAVALFPELSTTGYSAEDLFLDQDLQTANVSALTRIMQATTNIVAVVGAPWQSSDGRHFNCAFVFANGKVLGAVPKSNFPNYGEFYERRWFSTVTNLEVEDASLGNFLIDANQLFSIGPATLAIEVCEDLWAPKPPGADHALAGANLILNLSASNELIGKADYRRDLVRMTSAQRLCAYLYASSGPWESTKDVVFGGHLIATENGQMLAESHRFDLSGEEVLIEFDFNKIAHDRRTNQTFATAVRPPAYPVQSATFDLAPLNDLLRTYPKHPFVPDDEKELSARACEVLAIQATGLARRMKAAKCETLVLGLSGGLDSTLAFLVCLEALKKNQLDVNNLHAITMPGPGTGEKTLANAQTLAKTTNTKLITIAIDKQVELQLNDLRHDGMTHDVVYENVQARTRTQLLFNRANQVNGLVVGTGDLSELALGWCTFNADQMSSYNVNASVPKTMIAYIVRWYANHRASEALASVLNEVLNTPISPELIPAKEGKMQNTEALVGPYELHDFFLFHRLRNGSSVTKIFALAAVAFSNAYTKKEIRSWLRVFIQRFYSQQFKRTTLPPGPKVGSISLSPRGDWRMPDEAEFGHLLKQIDAIEV